MDASGAALSEHKHASAMATAAMMEMISHAQAIQAAVIRGAPAEEVDAIRTRGMDWAAAYFDHMTAAATHVRQIVEP